MSGVFQEQEGGQCDWSGDWGKEGGKVEVENGGRIIEGKILFQK